MKNVCYRAYYLLWTICLNLVDISVTAYRADIVKVKFNTIACKVIQYTHFSFYCHFSLAIQVCHQDI